MRYFYEETDPLTNTCLVYVVRKDNQSSYSHQDKILRKLIISLSPRQIFLIEIEDFTLLNH